MLLQTNSYVVPKDRRAEHQRLMRRFRQTLVRLGCDSFEVYEQVGSNWSGNEATGRYVQMMKFRDRKHQQRVQQGERTDAQAQALIAEFCEMINFPYQQQQGLFAVGFYASAMPFAPARAPLGTPAAPAAAVEEPADEAQPAEVNGEASHDASASDPAELEALELGGEAGEGEHPVDLDELSSDGSTPDDVQDPAPPAEPRRG